MGMNELTPTSTQHWVDLIAKSELPAITSTAKMLDRFNNDDKSSLPKLSKAILHDQALASCLLRVANSVQHLSVNKVNTVSRASVILGIQAVKNICLTSRLVEGLLKNKDLDIKVYTQLTKSMASSFYAGLLAKMMAPQYAEDTQEELYLAAMLYRIGETAFWGVGEQAALTLSDRVHDSANEFSERCQQLIGTNFTDLSTELAKTWHLSDLLLKALDNPKSRTVEVQIIYFADKLSNCIATPNGSKAEFDDLLKSIADIMGINTRQLTIKIEQLRETATKLLNSYGASVLIEYIKPLPNAVDFIEKNKQVLRFNPQIDKELLKIYMQLTQQIKSSGDLNKLLQTCLKAMAKIFAFECCTFLLLVDDKSAIKSRFSYDITGERMEAYVQLNLIRSPNVISEVIRDDQAIFINDYQEKKWYQYMTGEFIRFVDNGTVAIAPVKIGNTDIGVITAQTFVKDIEISESLFQQFAALVEHLNMCLTMISHKH
jgi:HD-like signal output (HDOD) protein